MQTLTHPVPQVKTTLWLGRILSALPVLFLLLDAAIKVMNIQPVVDASVVLGLPVAMAPSIGLLLLICLAVYLVPQSAFLGVVLLTGYLGGALALQVRIEAPSFSLGFPLLLGALLWTGLILRNPRLYQLLLPN